MNAVQNDQSTFLVIDRAGRSCICQLQLGEFVSITGCRQKFDNKVKQLGTIRRLRCDLEHLRLANVDEFANNNTVHTNLVGLCKHLCGVATDFAIKCVENAQQQQLQFASLFLAACNWRESEFPTFSRVLDENFSLPLSNSMNSDSPAWLPPSLHLLRILRSTVSRVTEHPQIRLCRSVAREHVGGVRVWRSQRSTDNSNDETLRS